METPNKTFREKKNFLPRPTMVGDFNTTALKLNFSDQNGDKEKCLENTLNDINS